MKLVKQIIQNLLSSALYINISLDWRLNGDPIDIKKSNTASLRIASEDYS